MFKTQLDGVLRRMKTYMNDLEKVQTDHCESEWFSVYTELSSYIENECTNLTNLVEQGDGVELLVTGRKRKKRGRIKLHERQILDLLYDVIKNRKHIIFDKCDIFEARFLAQIMTVFEDEPGFYHRSFNEGTQIARELGSMLARDGVFMRKRANEYVPADPDTPRERGKKKKKGNRAVNLWIIRNENVYQKMGPADFYREFERQKREAMITHTNEFNKLYPGESVYNNPNKRVVPPPPVEETPSFM